MNREFTDDKKELFNLVSISNKYRVEGSANINKIVNYGDIDLLDIAKNKHTPEEILKHFIGVFEDIKKYDDVVITDFKCGKHKGSALRWTYDDLKKGSNKGVSFFDALKMESTIKLDVVANMDGRFLEITTVYDFGHNYKEISTEEFIEGLIEDYKTNIKEKNNYFKALKRVFLIMKVKNKKNKMLKKLIDFFNQPIGLLYRLKSDLETTLLVINKFSIDDVKNNLDFIKEQLSSFDLKNHLINIKKKNKNQLEKNITKQIEIVNEYLNKEVKAFVEKNKL